MSSPRSVRFDPGTLDALAAFAARHPGLTSSSAAALLVEEGLRMDAHPGIMFRRGPTGRRAAIVGGPDVREVIRALRDTRAAVPEATAEQVVDILCENAGLDRALVQRALDYYGSYPEEVDAHVNAADAAEAEFERSLARTRGLLGA